MGWKNNQVQRLSFGVLILFFATLDASQNNVNESIKVHQSTFENVAMEIWDLAEVGYQEYKSAEILINTLKAMRLLGVQIIQKNKVLTSPTSIFELFFYWGSRK